MSDEADVRLPCRIYEYDGAYRCYEHDRMWGAITNPDEPCPGFRPSTKTGWQPRPVSERESQDA